MRHFENINSKNEQVVMLALNTLVNKNSSIEAYRSAFQSLGIETWQTDWRKCLFDLS